MKQSIDRLRERQEELRYRASSSGTYHSDVKIQTSSRPDKMENMIIKINELNEQIDSLLWDYARKKDEVINLIQQLDDVRYMTILYDKYVLGKDLRTIANTMQYEYRWTSKLHGYALKEIQMLLDKAECN